MGCQPRLRTAAVSPVAVLPAARDGNAQPKGIALLSLPADPVARHESGLSGRPGTGAVRGTADGQWGLDGRPAAVQHGHGRDADRSRRRSRLEEGTGHRPDLGLRSDPVLSRLPAGAGRTAAQRVAEKCRLHGADRRVRRASAGDVQRHLRHEAEEQSGGRDRDHSRQEDRRDGFDAPVCLLWDGSGLRQHWLGSDGQRQGRDRADDQGSGGRPLVEVDVRRPVSKSE